MISYQDEGSLRSDNFSISPFYWKLISLINFLIIMFCLIIIVLTPPARGYEFSPYVMYPWYFWAGVLISFFLACFQILFPCITRQFNKYWKIGLLSFLLSDIILIALPQIRMYFYYGRGDALTHIGLIRDILISNRISGNEYPVLHIFIAIINQITDIDPYKISMFIPWFYGLFFILTSYLLGRVLFRNWYEIHFLTVLSSILILGNSYFTVITPNSQAVLIIPFIFYLFFKLQNNFKTTEFDTLLVILLFLVVFFHPLITFFLILIMIIIKLVSMLPVSFIENKTDLKNIVYLLSIMIVTFFTWSAYLMITFKQVLKPLYRSLFETASHAEINEYIDKAAYSGADNFEIIKLVIYTYGQYLILGLAGCICLFIILNEIWKNSSKTSYNHLFFGAIFTAFNIFAILMLFTNGTFGFIRIVKFNTIPTLLLIASSFSLILPDLSSKENSVIMKNIKTALIILFISSLIILTTFNLYNSPIIKKMSQEVPASDFEGMNTFFKYRDESFKTVEFGIYQDRFYDAIYGKSALRINIRPDTLTNPQDHFGFDINNKTQSTTSTTQYLLLNSAGRGYYPNLYPEYETKWRFTQKDFYLLDNDKKIYRFYDNGNLESFLFI